MKLTWFGHAMFLIETGTKRIVTDPYSPEVGYPIPEIEADAVTVSHQHYDHNNVKAVRGKPVVVSSPGQFSLNGTSISGLETFHDELRGSKRGKNVIFRFTDDITVAHLGDYGEEKLRPETEKFLKSCDALLVPTGGIYTIDPAQAVSLIEALKPRAVIPMHYKTDRLTFELAGIDEFLNLWHGDIVHAGSTIELSANNLPSATTVYVMEYRVQ